LFGNSLRNKYGASSTYIVLDIVQVAGTPIYSTTYFE
jgi:hypothetical protein